MVGDGVRTIAFTGRGAANDDPGAESKIGSAVLTIARLIGQQIAREAFERPGGVSDNAPACDVGEDREIR